ncbi:class I SAM-dependent methyltransferase [Salegentibacter sediminis]|uniref:class I SAM-dependent methyltransferase n=1 Tax=Salegentibacter sediminis TaxID=1930251 RepID=UPI0009BE2CCD|nr:class I SAM-dependent methyltransferase [Salegentibacter sediminis]
MEQIQAFNWAAEDYDHWFDIHAKWFYSELEAVRVAIPNSGKAVEIGVGTGRFAESLGIKYGLEPSENMAAIAMSRGIDVQIGRGGNMPYPDASFDFSLMVTVDCFLQNIEQVFREAWRITKPGGTIIIGMIDKSSPLGKKYQKHKNNNPYYKSAHFHEVPEITKLLEKAGFSEFKYWQTLLNLEEEKFEEPQKGYGNGGFVVIRAHKK